MLESRGSAAHPPLVRATPGHVLRGVPLGALLRLAGKRGTPHPPTTERNGRMEWTITLSSTTLIVLAVLGAWGWVGGWLSSLAQADGWRAWVWVFAWPVCLFFTRRVPWGDE